MTTVNSPRRSMWWYLRITLRLTALSAIVFGPIVGASLAVHRAERAPVPYIEVHPSVASGPLAEGVREYLERRHPVVDRLLPEGAGGTRFFEELDGKAGMAFLPTAAIGLSAPLAAGGWTEATELHERAHLMHAFLPAEVSRLMARLPAPQPHEYAATNRTEHIAEMAAAAWEIVAEPGLFCVDGTPVERLHDAERRIPGTAGFVAWYLRALEPGGVLDHDALSRTAGALIAPDRAEWDGLWRALEQRRQPDRGFRPWPPPTVREYLETQRTVARTSSNWIDWIGGHLLTPSLTVLAIAGR